MDQPISCGLVDYDAFDLGIVAKSRHVQCRLSVRRTSKPSQPLFESEIERWKSIFGNEGGTRLPR